jgi:uncharacterized protein (TIGR03086 family)
VTQEASVDLPALLEQTIASTGKVVAGVRPDQLAHSTPCTEWNVRALLNHLIGVAESFSHVGEGKPISPPDPRADYFEGDGYAAAYESATSRLLAAWRKPGALDAPITLPIGDVPGSVGATINFLDLLVHGWDLAKATGQDATLEAALAEPALELARGFVTDDIRGRGAVGPEVPVPSGAGAGERLIGFMGRTP